MSKDKDAYQVGYGKPPKATRFKKGRSGNPKGRPKGSRNFKTDLDEVLNMQMTINENGRSRKVSALKATLMRLVEKALNGDPRAIACLLAMASERSAEKDDQSRERTLSAQENDILRRFLEEQGVEMVGEEEGDGE